MEATRLLKKSIIPVESEDVEINLFKNYKVERNKVVPIRESTEEANKLNKTQMDLDESIEKLKLNNTMKLKGDEYEEIKEMIVYIVREYEKEYETSITQLKIIETIVEKKIDLIDDKEKAEHMINIISSVINNLYEKEGILVLVEDNDEEDKRVS